MIKRENAIRYVDVESKEHIYLECLKDNDIESLTVLIENQLKDDKGCICDKYKAVIFMR